MLGWRVYVRWITWVWEGKVAQVIEELAVVQAESGPAGRVGRRDPPASWWLRRAGLPCVNQSDKMKYPEYRRQGLPITSSLVESTVKQINHRVKGTEKFWTRSRRRKHPASYAPDQLSDGVLEKFWLNGDAGGCQWPPAAIARAQAGSTSRRSRPSLSREPGCKTTGETDAPRRKSRPVENDLTRSCALTLRPPSVPLRPASLDLVVPSEKHGGTDLLFVQ